MVAPSEGEWAVAHTKVALTRTQGQEISMANTSRSRPLITTGCLAVLLLAHAIPVSVSAQRSSPTAAQLVDRVEVCNRRYEPDCVAEGFTSDVGSVLIVRARARSASGVDLTPTCEFVWASSVPGVVLIVPSTDATHRDAVITRLAGFDSYAKVASTSVTASCGGQTGVFNP